MKYVSIADLPILKGQVSEEKNDFHFQVSVSNKMKLFFSQFFDKFILLKIAAAAQKAPSPSHYPNKSYWKMDATESIFRNSGAAIFGRDKSDILFQKQHLREKKQVPAPGTYRGANFSDFTGLKPLPSTNVKKMAKTGQIETPAPVVLPRKPAIPPLPEI